MPLTGEKKKQTCIFYSFNPDDHLPSLVNIAINCRYTDSENVDRSLATKFPSNYVLISVSKKPVKANDIAVYDTSLTESSVLGLQKEI